MIRRLLLLLVFVLVAAGCTSGSDEGTPAADREPGRAGCHGVTYDQVRGARLHYGPTVLPTYPGSNTLCAAYWLAGADNRFTPQGLALDGDTVWVSGFRYDNQVGDRQCVLMQVSKRTGKRITGITPIEGAVPGRETTYCRHGGGLAITDEGLWVLETMRLWLLDPDLVGTDQNPVERVWSIVKPLRGSSLVDADGQLGIGSFNFDGRRGDVEWFRIDDLMQPGVIEIASSNADHRSRGIRWLQGGTQTDRGLYLTQSNTRCGILRLPSGRRVAVAPGTEDLEFDPHGDLWTVAEAGAKIYQREGGRLMVPHLARYDARALLRGPRPSCDL
ncbi:hypothetical protein ABLE68_10120 [Nocardioides sp. CN2-186]|uniref:hypothetical protein n=1 Tax=Nocardioides tweenelious TaxID=3156607 RepID=UPI0032B5CA42